MASARQICTTTAINTVSCYKSNCIPASHGNPSDCRFVGASNTRQLRLVKQNGVSETNLHNHCNQHGQLLQIQLHSSVARQSRRLSIRRSVEHAPTRDWSNEMASARQICTTTAITTVSCYKSNCISSVARQSRRLSIRRSVEHAPTRDWSNEMASARQICTTTAINTVSCYKSNCIRGSHGNPGDCRSSELPDSCSLLRASRMIAIHHFSLHFNHVLV
jgi:hypothetical protein